MDKLYVGNDIPLDFNYAIFNSDYVDLYNTNNIRPNSNYTYYRIYNYGNGFYYNVRDLSTGSWVSDYDFTRVETTNNYMYRRDIDGIFVLTFCFVIFGLWLLNFITSIIRKGGVLGGLF